MASGESQIKIKLNSLPRNCTSSKDISKQLEEEQCTCQVEALFGIQNGFWSKGFIAAILGSFFKPSVLSVTRFCN